MANLQGMRKGFGAIGPKPFGALRKIAGLMHSEAKSTGKSTWTLPRGLRLKLSYSETDIVLTMWRRNCAPSDVEVQTCADYFFPNKTITNYVQKGRYTSIGVTHKEFTGPQLELNLLL